MLDLNYSGTYNLSVLDAQSIGNRYLNSADHLPLLTPGQVTRVREFVECEYHKMLDLTGVRVYLTSEDPYHGDDGKVNSKLMRGQVLATGKLYVTTRFNNSDLLGPEVNLMFRSYHDLCHVYSGGSFSFLGEARTALPMLLAAEGDGLVQNAVFSEIIAQRAAYEVLGDFPEGQKLVLAFGNVLQAMGFKGR